MEGLLKPKLRAVMPTIIYRAQSQADLYSTHDLLTRNGIAATIVGDPERNRGPKVGFLVELAVADEQAAKARDVIARHNSAEEERIQPLTADIRRTAILAVVIVVLFIVPVLVFVPDLAGWLPSILMVGGLIILSILASRRSALRESRFRSAHCVECGYHLRGNRSGKCPECGTTVPKRRAGSRTRQKRRR